MEKEDIKFKLTLIEAEIEMMKATSKWSKDTDKGMIFIALITGVVIVILNTGRELRTFDIFAISIYTCTTYKFITDMITNNRDDKFKLKMLEMDKKHYTRMLKIKEDEEDARG
ncbi:MAG: hypothetical protein ACRCX2_33640 [Paraclostridium sp.]